MVIGNAAYSVRDYFKEGRVTLLTFPEMMAEIGIKAFEYNDIFFESFEDSYLKQVKEAAEKAGGEIVCVTCGSNFCSGDAEERKKQVETIRQRIRDAQALGAGVIRANLGGTGDEEKDGTVGVQMVIDAFNDLLPTAQECGVKITIENHGGVSKTADNILKVVLGTDPEWVGTCPDLGNFPIEVRYRELGKVFPYAYHVHLKTHEFNPDGEESETDVGRVIRMLKDVDNTAVLSIEFEGSGDQMEGTKKTKALMEKYL